LARIAANKWQLTADKLWTVETTSSPWQGVGGYHVLRHRFLSALGSEGEDQRVIDEVADHQTKGQRKRYRHPCPNVMRE
jgi:hypothetical protein